MAGASGRRGRPRAGDSGLPMTLALRNRGGRQLSLRFDKNFQPEQVG
ncbi:hypothetical protein [Streptomyces canus]|nr:hypothetical protein [Streptomyces canus]